jgi:hypothetical protein
MVQYSSLCLVAPVRNGGSCARRRSRCAFGLGLSLILVATAGCINLPHALPKTFTRPVGLFPENALITQRGILTALGKQYTMNGYVALDETGDMRLILTELFGQVLADVLVKHDGTVHVMRSSKMLRPAWVERYVAADLKCLFGKAPAEGCPVRMVDKTHFIVGRRWYSLDLRIVEIKPGRQPAQLFEENRPATP